ncbi:MAG: D-alanyl-D-alanine carboxypeptidase [Firmicutes bacterium]|nr:D-alanyl-D-alanine carboxypeptidase [Bacillota bacterium]
MKRICHLLICFLFIPLLFATTALAQAQPSFDVDAPVAMLMVPKTGQILYAKEVDRQLPPASIAKVMTMLLAMEAVEEGRVSLEDEVRVSAFAESMGGSQVWLVAGEVFTLEELMRAIAIPSANDAAVAVAEHVYGSVGAFVDAMNAKARALGMNNTVFTNVTGLPPEDGQQPTMTTARDISIMARELLKYPKVLEWTSIPYAIFRENPLTALWNTNKLIGSYEGADGLKTGYTREAGYCLVGTAQRNGLRLLSIVMQTESDLERQLQSARLLDYGFRAFVPMTVVKKGEALGTIAVENAAREQVPVVAQQELEVLVLSGRQGEVVTELVPNTELSAPIAKGDVLGTYRAVLDGEVVSEVPAVAEEDIAVASWFVRLWRWVRDLILGLVASLRDR